jgi:hypothetical protein
MKKINLKKKLTTAGILIFAGLLMAAVFFRTAEIAYAFPTNTTVLDDFNRANGDLSGSTSSSGDTWPDSIVVSDTTLSIVSNRIESLASFRSGYMDNTYGPDTEVYATLTETGSAGGASEILALFARISNPDASNITAYYVEIRANGDWVFIRVNSSATTVPLATVTQTLSDGDSVGFSVTGTGNPLLTAWHKPSAGSWTQVDSAFTDDFSNTPPASQAPFQGSGKIGIEIQDAATSPSVDDFSGGTVVTNVAPNAPTLSAPASGATGVNPLPQFDLAATDADGDYLRYEIVLYQSNCSTVVRTIDQTASQTGWSGQDTQGGTAYTSGTTATHTYQTPALAAGTTYCWKARAIDPGGLNTFGAYSGTQSFTTNQAPATPTLINPSSAQTQISVLPQFTLRTTDAETNSLQYHIKVYSSQTECNNDSGTNLIRSIDQSASQTGWQLQDKTLPTAYSSGTTINNSSIALHHYQPSPLNINTTYWWKGRAIDPGGANTWSSWATCTSFTTPSGGEVQIQGGVEIRGGTTIQ